MRGTVEGPERYAQDLTHLIDKVDLPGLIGEHFPESGCKPSTAGSFKAVWRGDERASGSVYRNEKGAWLWKDHGVGGAGTAYHFLTEILDMDNSKAAEEVKRLAHVTHEASAQATSMNRTPRRLVERYDYVDQQDNLLFQALRYEPKGFSQRRPDGKGGWIHTLQGVTPVLYRLPRVLEAIEDGRAVYVVEGEKDVHTLEELGKVATCNPMGAGKWKDSYSDALQGAHVIILPDNDQAGINHTRSVALSLEEKVASLRIVKLPGLEPKEDITDWMAKGHLVDDLNTTVSAAEVWTPDNRTPLVSFVESLIGNAEPTSQRQDKGEASWKAIEPLPSLYPPVPPLPPELIPTPLRPWLLDISERASLPLEFVTCPALVALSAVVGRSVGIYPKRRDDWLVVPNLWGGIVGRPGVMKSAAISEPTKPLRALAAKARERFQEKQRDAEAEKSRLELEVSALKEQAKQDAKKGGISTEFQRTMRGLITQLEEATVTERRYLTQDPTVEKLGELLQENPRGMLVLRDELAGWLRTLERPGREGEREFYLEAWNGTGGYTFDRIGRGTVHIDALTLTILGAIQPGKLERYLDEAIAGGGGADGLLQRFQLVVYPDHVGEYKHVDRYPNGEARQKVTRIFEMLDTLDVAALGLDTQEDEIPALHFADDAQELFDVWRGELEQRLRGDEFKHTPAFESHLSKYRSLMPSLALIFHLVAVADGAASGPVALAAAQLAAVWCDYLEAHALKLYAREVSSHIKTAQLLAVKLEEDRIADGAKVRDIYNASWEGLSNRETVLSGLEVLAAHNWLRLEEQMTGGRPSQVVRLHPELRRKA